MRPDPALIILLAFMVVVPAAYAAQADPAADRITSFDDSLLSVMKQGKTLGFKGRAARFKPVVEQTFDLPVMTRFAVGPAWTTLSEADRTQLTSAFERLTVGTYAKNFDSFDGEQFSTDPAVQTRGIDKLVKTTISPSHGAPEVISYRMRQSASGGAWKIIDVYYRGGISELTTRRSDFGSTLANGGAPALVAHLNGLADNLAK